MSNKLTGVSKNIPWLTLDTARTIRTALNISLMVVELTWTQIGVQATVAI